MVVCMVNRGWLEDTSTCRVLLFRGGSSLLQPAPFETTTTRAQPIQQPPGHFILTLLDFFILLLLLPPRRFWFAELIFQEPRVRGTYSTPTACTPCTFDFLRFYVRPRS